MNGVRSPTLKDIVSCCLDFETTGFDILHDHIVKIGVLHKHLECFSTVACPLMFGDGQTV